MCPPKYLPKKPKKPELQIEKTPPAKYPMVVLVATALVVLAVSFLRAYLKETGVL